MIKHHLPKTIAFHRNKNEAKPSLKQHSCFSTIQWYKVKGTNARIPKYTAQTAEKEHFLGARACARATRRGGRAMCKCHKKWCKGLRIFQNFKSCFQHHIIECSVSLRCKGHMRGARASDLCKGLIFCLFTYILMIITMIWSKGLNAQRLEVHF